MLRIVVSNPLCRISAQVLSVMLCAVFFFTACLSAPAQEVAVANAPAPDVMARIQGRIADKPIVIGYARNISPARMIDYMKNLTTRLQIGKSFQEQLSSEQQQEQMEQISPKVQEPLYGFAMYMVAGLIPSFETVSFQQVVDEEDARRLVNGRKRQWGENGTLQDRGNGCFMVEYRNVSSFPLPPGADEKQYTNNNSVQQRGYQFSQKVIEKDGVKHVEHSQIITSLFRYHESLLYEANFEELFEMELPTVDAIKSGINGSTDLGFNAYLDRIPIGMRQLGWNMLAAAAGSQMQQQDDEPDSSYTMRKSAGDLGLSLIQAVLFDIDNSDGWAKFASVDDGSMRGELRIRARNNSELTKQLLGAAGNSRFAPILSDNAAATLHLCVRLPEEAPAALQATATWLTETMGHEFRNDAAMVTAGEALSGVLGSIAEHRNLELMLKAGWTEASGGVFYGGLHLNENPELLRNLHYLMTHMADVAPGIDQMITLEERQGMQLIVIRPPEEGTEEFGASIGVNVTHIYMAHQNACLWFAAGTENASEIIRQSVARCTENTRAARTPLVSGRIDMERWLSYPQDDPARIAQMPHWLDENAWWFPPNPMAMGYIGNQSGKPNPMMQQVYDLGGSQQAGFSLEADESGLLLQVTLGEALANHMVARMIDLQESMMVGAQKQAEEMQARQQEALKEAAAKLKPPEAP